MYICTIYQLEKHWEVLYNVCVTSKVIDSYMDGGAFDWVRQWIEVQDLEKKNVITKDV